MTQSKHNAQLDQRPHHSHIRRHIGHGCKHNGGNKSYPHEHSHSHGQGRHNPSAHLNITHIAHGTSHGIGVYLFGNAHGTEFCAPFRATRKKVNCIATLTNALYGRKLSVKNIGTVSHYAILAYRFSRKQGGKSVAATRCHTAVDALKERLIAKDIHVHSERMLRVGIAFAIVKGRIVAIEIGQLSAANLAQSLKPLCPGLVLLVHAANHNIYYYRQHSSPHAHTAPLQLSVGKYESNEKGKRRYLATHKQSVATTVYRYACSKRIHPRRVIFLGSNHFLVNNLNELSEVQ